LELLCNKQKYSRAGVWVVLFFLQGALLGGCGRMNYPGRSAADSPVAADTAARNTAVAAADSTAAAKIDTAAVLPTPKDTARLAESSLPIDTMALVDTLQITEADLPADSLAPPADSTALTLAPDSTVVNADSARRYKYGKPAFDQIITEKNRDSMIYNLASRRMYAYGQVEVSYGEGMKLTTELAKANLLGGTITAQPVLDSAGMPTRSKFTEGDKEYDIVDSITYNLNSSKGKFRGVWMQEGEGFLYASAGKKMPDNSIYSYHGFYTTCDAEHPHFGIRIDRGKLIPGKKTIFQEATLEIEDVSIPFAMIPFGLFPMNTENSAGFIVPSFGEDYAKGFYLGDGGYYFVLNDYVDLSLTGSVYSLGSWGTKAASRYTKRYRYSGNLNFTYNINKFGDRGSKDWGDSREFSIGWSHSQAAQAKPGQTFTASVNFSSSQNNRNSPTTMNDYINSQASSSIAYSRRWEGSPFNLTIAATHSQNNRDSTYSFTMPNASFSVSRLSPFKFKNRRPGPERWYEKISFNYNTSLTNQVSGVKEYNLFKPVMFDQMETSMTHSLPVSANFSIGGVMVGASLSYSERWNAKKNIRRWDPARGTSTSEKIRGFGRDYNYSGSVSANTTIYGMFNGFSEHSIFEAVRHTITPSVSFSFAPNFANPFFGLSRMYQKDAAGTVGYYNPYSGGEVLPGGKPSASLGFSLKQTVEAKIKSDRDSTGMRKINIIDDFTISGLSYNFMADSMKLSPQASVSLRSTLIKGFNINLNFGVGITAVDENARPINHYFWQKGSRTAGAGSSSLFIKNLSWSFSWNKNFGKVENSNTNNSLQQMNNQNIDMLNPGMNPLLDPRMDQMSDQEVQEHIYAYRDLQAGQYYDFSVPLSINASGSLSYSFDGLRRNLTPYLNFGGTVNLTPNWGINITSGYDFNARQITPNTNFSMVRNLHCMQMSFNWVPFGRFKSWNFRINVIASVLRDLKYDKHGSPYDNF
jgi:hypothetical protein